MQWNDLLIEGKTKKYTIISYTTYSLDYLKKTQKEYRYLKKNHIPIKHSPYVCTTSNLAVNLSNHYLGAVLLILYFLLIFDIFKEFDQGVYKILFTSKYDSLKIILTKVVFSFFVNWIYWFDSSIIWRKHTDFWYGKYTIFIFSGKSYIYGK